VIEAELKARLSDAGAVRAQLGQRATAEKAIYRDTYYDTPAGSLERDGREVRLRSVERNVETPVQVSYLLTYKEAVVEEASGSKPEYETTLASPDAVAHLLEGLGYSVAVELTKDCENYRFSHGGRDFLATVVQVPEIEGTFLEIETQADVSDLTEALSAVRSLMTDLGIGAEALTTELYTDAVRAARQA
jgi:adenylate cyclase class 2